MPVRRSGPEALIHEFAVTENILKSALAEAEKAHARSITRIKLLVGEATNITPDCVKFYFNLMRDNTAARTAELDITTAPLRLRCPVCRREFTDFTAGCACKAGIDVVSGQELIIEYIEVDEENDGGEKRKAGSEKQ